MATPSFRSYSRLDGNVLLMEAVLSGDKDELLQILHDNYSKIEADLNHPVHGPMYLCAACRLGYEDIVTLLTGYYTNINSVTDDGTPLSLACQYGYVDIVDILLCSEATLLPPSETPFCPFRLAAYNGWVDVMERLLVQIPEALQDATCQLLVLQKACQGGHLQMVQYCLKQCEAANAETTKLLMPDLVQAACHAHNAQVLNYLLQQQPETVETIPVAIVDRYSSVFTQVLQSRVQPLDDDEQENGPIEGAAGHMPPDNERVSSEQKLTTQGWKHCHLPKVSYDWVEPFSPSLYVLDLSHNQLRGLPSELPWALPNLHVLDLSWNHLQTLPAPDSYQSVLCVSLEEVHLHHNQLTGLPHQLFQLPTLQHLDAKCNQIHKLGSLVSDDPSQRSLRRHLSRSFHSTDTLWICHKLEVIDLCYNQLTQLPLEMAVCCNLRTLRAAHNQLTSFINPWSCQLEELELSHNQLAALPCSMEDFWSHSLLVLSLSNNLLTEISQSICWLKHLRKLDISHNQVHSLPNHEWWKTEELEQIDLSHNALDYIEKKTRLSQHGLVSPAPDRRGSIHFPAIIKDTLTVLDLSYNKLSCVPPSVCQLTNLRTLDLGHNTHLHYIPPEMGQLKECYSLGLDGLYIRNIPLKERFQGSRYKTKIVLAHLHNLHRRCLPYNRMKLMVIGREGKGKSTLLAVLKGQPLPPNVATNGVVIDDWHVQGAVIRRQLKQKSQQEFPDIVLQTWDFAGQSDFYVTHKLFLSPCALYLLLYDLRTMTEGVKKLRPWLLDIQAHAPKSHVIIVGTFLDCLDDEGRRKIGELKREIIQSYQLTPGYPQVDMILEVSSVTQENLAELMHGIYTQATKMPHFGMGRVISTRPRGHREKILGRMVPKSYLDLAEKIKEEARRRPDLPVLHVDEVMTLAQTIEGNDITKAEDLELATRFLVEAGVILHYDSNLRDLHHLYFIDPSWLARTLATFITVELSHRCIKDGILHMNDAQVLLFKDQTDRLKQYIDLLEKFEIALQIDTQRLLIPSKLPNSRPGLLLGDNMRPRNTLHRLYKMKYIPNGLWSRLITQVLFRIQQGERDARASGSKNNSNVPWSLYRFSQEGSFQAKARVTYWQEGIQVYHDDQMLCIESTCPYVSVGGACPVQGILISVHSQTREHPTMGFAVDQVESLVQQWYPGLINDTNDECMERLIPCPACVHRKGGLNDFKDVHLFPVHECILAFTQQSDDGRDDLLCPECGRRLEPRDLLPELNFTDVMNSLMMSPADVHYNEETDLVGRGGEGQVYRATVEGAGGRGGGRGAGGLEVAVKQNCMIYTLRVFLEKAQRGAETDGDGDVADDDDAEARDEFADAGAERAQSPKDNSASAWDSVQWVIKNKLLMSFIDFRKEVKLLDELHHPCIIQLLGILPPQLSYVMQLAPLGNLHSVLQKERAKQKVCLRWSHRGEEEPLFGRMLTYKIVQQIAMGLEYLHGKSIAYKDVKPHNVLVWSLDPADTVNIKLSDYGLSAYLTPQGLRGYEGTVGYQAPEMRKGHSYNEKVDIFALGVVIYQVLSGRTPYEHLPSVSVPRAIEQGRRPCLEDHHVSPEMPWLVSLMEKCWQKDPKERPHACEIVARTKDMTFFSLKRVLQQQLPRVQAVYQPTELDGFTRVETPYLRCVTGTSSATYHITNVARGECRFQEPCSMAQVVCMTLVGQLLVIGTRDCHLSVLTNDKKTGDLVPVVLAVSLDDVPLAMGTKKIRTQGDSGSAHDLFVSLANGHLNHYIIRGSPSAFRSPGTGRQSVEFEQHHDRDLCRTEKGVRLDCPSKCMTLVRHNQELWVGCGPDIVILDLDRFEVAVRVRAAGDEDTGALVNQICCQGNHVWCYLWQCWEVLEFDVATRTKVCVFDCSLGSAVDTVVVHFQAPPLPRRARQTCVLPEPRCQDDELPDYANANMMTGFVRGRPTIPPKPQLQREKLLPELPESKRQKPRRDISWRRRQRPGVKQPTTDTRSKQSYHIRSMCYSSGSLWVGRRSGDILVINVTQNNSYQYEFGQVLAVLCSEYLNSYSSVDHLVNLHDKWIVAARTRKDSVRGEEKSELTVWTALDLAQIHQVRRCWQDIDEACQKPRETIDWTNKGKANLRPFKSI